MFTYSNHHFDHIPRKSLTMSHNGMNRFPLRQWSTEYTSTPVVDVFNILVSLLIKMFLFIYFFVLDFFSRSKPFEMCIEGDKHFCKMSWVYKKSCLVSTPPPSAPH